MRKQRVMVVGEDPFNFEKLHRLRGTDKLEFQGLFRIDEVQADGDYPLPTLHADAVAHLDACDALPDGIMSYWDFPATSLVALLHERYGLCGPSLEAVLKCEHKYWSRLEQQRAVPEVTPGFQVFDPFDPRSVQQLDLQRPVWIKPIKSHSSQLGFRVTDHRELRTALSTIRMQIDRFAAPFQFVLDRASLPDDVAHIDGRHCLAEQIIEGEQCTAEGFVYRGETTVYAIIDSIRHNNCSSFARYQYPTRLPLGVQQRISEACARVMQQVEFDNGTFNVEFFWDRPSDALWLLEVNPRLSQSHADITEKVDGVSNLEKMVALCLGQRPDPIQGQGSYRCAAKCFIRSFTDGLVREVPSADKVARIERDIPGVRLQIVAEPGRRLSDMQNQDSYSYELALVHVGGKDERSLVDKFERCRRALHFQVDAFDSPFPARVHQVAAGAQTTTSDRGA